MSAIKHIVSFSGGMGSFAEAKACVDKFGKENVLLLFCDTLMEDEDLYRFLDDTVNYLDCEFVRICYGKTPWELFEAQKFIGNSRLDLCSRVLKRDFMSNVKNGWLFKNFGKIVDIPVKRADGTLCFYTNGKPVVTKTKMLVNCEVHVGIDFSEHHRLTRITEIMKPTIYRSTLVEDGLIIPKDYSKKFGITPPRLYSMGFAHNNCGGFCVKAGLGQFKKLFEEMPDRYKWHEQQEEKLLKMGCLPFLKKTINKKVVYISLKEYRENYIMLGKAEEDTFDIGGCACSLPA